MDNILYIDTENMQFPVGSREHKTLIMQSEKNHGQQYILCFNNMSSTKVSKSQPLKQVVEKNFVIPYVNSMDIDTYGKWLEVIRANHFHKTVSTIPGIKIINKSTAEFSPYLSQICTGALLTDKKGRVLVLVRTLEDNTQQFYIPQSHMEYTPEIYTKNLDTMICESANNCLNNAINIKRIEGELEPISLISGYIVNTSETLATSMHTLFTTVYQVDDFMHYEVRCNTEGQTAMILDLDEAVTAAGSHMMDPWLSFVYLNMMA